MSRGTLYCVAGEMDSVGKVHNAADAIMCLEHEPVEWCDEFTDVCEAIETVLKRLKGSFKKVSDPDGKPCYEVVFPQKTAETYFKENFAAFKTMAEMITLEEFSKSVFRLERSINDRYDDAVVDEFGTVHTFDSWVRTIVPGETYYFYYAVIMH